MRMQFRNYVSAIFGTIFSSSDFIKVTSTLKGKRSLGHLVHRARISGAGTYTSKLNIWHAKITACSSSLVFALGSCKLRRHQAHFLKLFFLKALWFLIFTLSNNASWGCPSDSVRMYQPTGHPSIWTCGFYKKKTRINAFWPRYFHQSKWLTDSLRILIGPRPSVDLAEFQLNRSWNIARVRILFHAFERAITTHDCS